MVLHVGQHQVFQVELPDEVRDYLAAMARRINAAHAALEVTRQKQAARAEPIFTTPARP